MPLPITLSARLHIQLRHLKGFFLENKGVSTFENVPFVYSFAPSHFSVYVKELGKKYAWLMSDLKKKLPSSPVLQTSTTMSMTWLFNFKLYS
jgi:hypothetical protein